MSEDLAEVRRIPEQAQRRLEEMRGQAGGPPRLFTSDLSVNEFLMVEEAGFEPLGFVMGSSFFHVGIQWTMQPFQNYELDILTAALRYPWPAVAMRAGDVIAKLGRKDLVPELIDALDQPDPRAPRMLEVAGQIQHGALAVSRVQLQLFAHVIQRNDRPFGQVPANPVILTRSGQTRQHNHFGAKVLILDEPTSALGVKQAGVVLRYVVQARDRGLGVIFITHNPHHAYPVGDHFIVLNRGRMIADRAKSAISREELTSLMAGGAELEALSHELERSTDRSLAAVGHELEEEAHELGIGRTPTGGS